jgi:hypothetical protein
MNTTSRPRIASLALLTLTLAVAGCNLGAQQPPAKAPPAAPAGQEKAADVKRVPMGKNVLLELQGDQRRVVIQAEVCFREGPLELFLCRKNTKEHEAIVTADIDARQVHMALLAAGAKEGSPVRFEPKYQAATGSVIKISVEYEKDGKTVRVPAQSWVRDAKTRKELEHPWVFGGSMLFDNPDDPNTKAYAANGGDVICVANFPDAMLDLPVQSPKEWEAGRLFEAFTERIPPLQAKVTVILEPTAEKK